MVSTGNNGRHARSSEVLREVNESIRALAGRAGGSESWEFLCECDDDGCFELVSLSLGEYDACRGVPPARILAHPPEAYASSKS